MVWSQITKTKNFVMYGDEIENLVEFKYNAQNCQTSIEHQN